MASPYADTFMRLYRTRTKEDTAIKLAEECSVIASYEQSNLLLEIVRDMDSFFKDIQEIMPSYPKAIQFDIRLKSLFAFGKDILMGGKRKSEEIFFKNFKMLVTLTGWGGIEVYVASFKNAEGVNVTDRDIIITQFIIMVKEDYPDIVISEYRAWRS